MKLLLVAVAALMACGPGIPLPTNASLSPETDAFGMQLARASQSGDVATIRRMLGPHTVIAGLWFADTNCFHEFAVPGEVAGGRLDELARCLAGVKLAMTKRKEILDDVVVLSYAPGFEIEARILATDAGPWVSWLGYESKLDSSDQLPTVTVAALEKLRVAGDPHASLTALRRGEGAWTKFCVDATGAVTSVRIRAATSLEAGRAVSDIVRQWRFNPFVPGSQPLPVCAVELLGNANLGRFDIAPPAIAPPNGEPIVLAAFYRTQKIELAPVPLGLRKQLFDQGIRHIPAMVMVCIDASGSTYGVRMIRPTGLPIYDQHIVARYSQAHFEPYRDRGAPVSVCAWDFLDIDTTVEGRISTKVYQ